MRCTWFAWLVGCVAPLEPSTVPTEPSRGEDTGTPVGEVEPAPNPVLRVASVVPDDGWAYVRPLAPVTVTFDHDLDVDSLATAEVHVVDDMDLIHEVTITPRNDRTIDIVPEWPWPDDRIVTVWLEGARSIEGAVHTPLRTSFRVHHSPRAVRAWQDPLSPTTYAYTSTLNDDGSLATRAWVQSPGPDLTWFTADDVPNHSDTYTVLDKDTVEIVRRLRDGTIVRRLLEEQDGLVFRSTTYDDPGSDGLWATDDDVPTLLGESTRVRDPELARWTALWSQGPGDDGVWMTADDAGLSASTYARNRFGVPVEGSTMEHPGADGRWFTSDDVASTTYEVREDPTGRGWLVVFLGGPDQIYLVQRYVEVGDTMVQETLGAGPDGIWATVDDETRSETTNYYSPEGLLVRRVSPVWEVRNTYTDGGILHRTYSVGLDTESFAEWADPFPAGPESP